MKTSRNAVVNLVNSWLGKNESDGSYREIVNIYNSFKGQFPRGIKMKYEWAWCACTWSALAIKLGYTNIMPIEISCGYLIEAAKRMGCWKENDSYIPKAADAILYDWDDSGNGENTAWPDHVGVVVEVHKDAGYLVVVEGNYGNAVKKRTLSINGRYIRGFITPAYDEEIVSAPVLEPGQDLATIAREVISGKWGNGDSRKKKLETHGYNYAAIQKKVNEILNGSVVTPTKPAIGKEVTATCYAQKYDKGMVGIFRTVSDLYLRNDAGTNKKALVVIPENTEVRCYGYYNESNGVKWPYVQFTLNGVKYTGFCCGTYLKQ